MNIFKSSAHGVLTANSADAQFHLSAECTQYSRKGGSPSHIVTAQLLEVFLKAKIHVFELGTGCNQLADTLYNGEVCAWYGLFSEMYGLNPYAIMETVFTS